MTNKGAAIVLWVAVASTALTGCGSRESAPAETADEFVARLNREATAWHLESSQADWIQATYITPDTQAVNARTRERYLAWFGDAVAQSRQYDLSRQDDGQPMSDASRRALHLLRLQVASPGPDDPARRGELTKLASGLEAAYGEAKFCVDGRDQPESCEGVDALDERLAMSRDYGELERIWTGWHDQADGMRADYQRFVELANEGARDLGFDDMGALWRSQYDMEPDVFTGVAAKLWGQVKPLYEAMHCYARGRLADRYGAERVKAGEPMPAHLLGNMWAQSWNRIYDDVLKPYPAVAVETADRRLKAQGWTAERMTRSAESFYTSLGFQALPATFWERSMLTRPRDREVVCHASAWTLDTRDDVRVKMCLQPTEADLYTAYHELGHIYYDLAYRGQPYLFQGAAHDGFHEAIGDTVNLSVTPGYMASLGLASAVAPSREALINTQMKMAADKIAFLPFGKVVDEWRWKVFSGEIAPADYNKTWWALRREYQGIAPPVGRDEAHFDPGAKYHVPANVPYTRYFLAFILQFQMHKALCDAAGFQGPLHECSVAGSQAAGAKFAAMLAAGASEPWPDTLEKLTGTREMDGAALIEYFAPLSAWLAERNAGQQCGWE